MGAPFLASYFLAAAIGLPLWVQLVKRWGWYPVGWSAWHSAWRHSALFLPWGLVTRWPSKSFACSRAGSGGRPDDSGGHLDRTDSSVGTRPTGRGSILRLVDGRHQAQPRAGLGPGAALAGLAGFQDRGVHPENLSALAWTYGVPPCLFKVAAGASLLAASRRYPILKGQSRIAGRD